MDFIWLSQSWVKREGQCYPGVAERNKQVVDSTISWEWSHLIKSSSAHQGIFKTHLLFLFQTLLSNNNASPPPHWNFIHQASRVAQRSKAMHRSARGFTTDPGSFTGCITTCRDRESHRAAHRALATPCGGPGTCRLNSVYSDTLLWLASRLSRRVLKSMVWRVMFRRTHDSTFASRAHWGVAAMRQNRNWGEKGGKIQNK